MSKSERVAGVYVVSSPIGVYVGQSYNCLQHNEKVEKLGLLWGVVVEMPGSTRKERMRAETVVADSWAARGFAVVSRNTTAHAELLARSRRTRRLGQPGWNKGTSQSPATKAKISAALKGRPSSFKGKKHSSETRAKMRLARNQVLLRRAS